MKKISYDYMTPLTYLLKIQYVTEIYHARNQKAVLDFHVNLSKNQKIVIGVDEPSGEMIDMNALLAVIIN